MTEKYFEKFPLIQYANTIAVDITRSAKVLDSIYNDPHLYYLYDIKQGERPDSIANRYYDDQYSDWILHLSNKIIDPYYQWYLQNEDFNAFVAKKYGSIQLAQLKYKFYRNNWYENQNPIQVSTFNALTASAKQYYEPDFGTSTLSITPLQYKRRKVDWIVDTNYLVKYAVANGANFSIDNLVNITYTGGSVGAGQVAGSNSTAVILRCMDSFQLISTGTLLNKENGSNTTFTGQTFVANNIPADEASFWSPVTYFEYEDEINENNKSIRVMNKSYYSVIAQNMKDIIA